MVPAAPPPDAHADRAWIARIRRLLRLNSGAVVIGVEGGSPSAARPLVKALGEGGQRVHVCLSGPDLEQVPPGSVVVLLNAARDADWLNLARPVVTERGLRLFVWLNPGDRATLRRLAPDFLDWMQQTVQVPDAPPGYAADALAQVLREGGVLVWHGPGLEALLPPEVRQVRADATQEEFTEALRQGPLVVRVVASEAELGRVLAARDEVGGTVILVDPRVEPSGAVIVDAEPLRWEVAADALARVGVARPGETAAAYDLNPKTIMPEMWVRPWAPRTWTSQGAVFSGPVRVGGGGGEWAERRASVHVTKPELVFRAFDPNVSPSDRNRDLIIQRPELVGLHHRIAAATSLNRPELHLICGGRGIGKSTGLTQLALMPGEHLRFVRCNLTPGVLVQPDLIPLKLTALVGLSVIKAGEELGHRWDSSAAAFLRVASDALNRPRIRLPLLPESILFDLVRPLFQQLYTYLGPPSMLVLALDGLDGLPTSALLSLSRRSSLLQSPPCTVIAAISWSGGRALVSRLQPRNTQVLFNQMTMTDPNNPEYLGPHEEFFQNLTRRRLASIGEPSWPERPIARLAWASGGNPGAFLLLVRSLVEEALVGEDLESELFSAPRLERVLTRARHDLTLSLTREDDELLQGLLSDPSHRLPEGERALELLDSGHICCFDVRGEIWYMPHPLLLDRLRS